MGACVLVGSGAGVHHKENFLFPLHPYTPIPLDPFLGQSQIWASQNIRYSRHSREVEAKSREIKAQFMELGIKFIGSQALFMLRQQNFMHKQKPKAIHLAD